MKCVNGLMAKWWGRVLWCFCLLPLCARGDEATSLEFAYDAAGNRTSRQPVTEERLLRNVAGDIVVKAFPTITTGNVYVEITSSAPGVFSPSRVLNHSRL